MVMLFFLFRNKFLLTPIISTSKYNIAVGKLLLLRPQFIIEEFQLSIEPLQSSIQYPRYIIARFQKILERLQLFIARSQFFFEWLQ